MFVVISVVHGLVCLSRPSEKYSSSTLLWNPMIRKYVEIPRSSAFQGPFGTRVSIDVGFGFSCREIDFKVVRVWPTEQLPRFEVFSTRKGRWRSVVFDESIGPCSVITDHSCYKDGSVHWIVRRNLSVKGDYVMAVLVFDCEREEFRVMDLSRGLNRMVRMRIFITCCGVISVLARKGRSEESWMMEEYGVVSSWKKLTIDREGNLVSNLRIRKISGVLMQPVFRKKHPLILKLVPDCTRLIHRPIGHVFEPSMFLMDANMKTVSYTMQRGDEEGKVYFVNDGRRCNDYVQFSLELWKS